MIPAKEIQRVIDELEGNKATKHMHQWNRGWNSASDSAIKKLKELIPSEPNFTSEQHASKS